MCIDEMNNFVEDDFPAIPLVFKIIGIIELIDLQYLVIGPNTNFWSEGRKEPG